jgi:hypothetical protein
VDDKTMKSAVKPDRTEVDASSDDLQTTGTPLDAAGFIRDERGLRFVKENDD